MGADMDDGGRMDAGTETGMSDKHSVWHRLFFTKDDDMDLTQVYFGVNVLFFWFAFAMAAAKIWTVSVAAWSVFGGVFATLAIAGTSHVVSKRLAESKAPAEFAKAVAMSTPLDTDDGRDGTEEAD